MIFKEPRLVAQFNLLPALLQEISWEFYFLSKAFGVDAVVTRITDPVEGESGVHRANRAIDFRDEYMGTNLYDKNDVMTLLQYFNAKYARNDNYQTLIWHSFRGMPRHFHFQMPPTLHSYVHKNKFAQLAPK